MQNNNFAATLASVASEFGVEDTAKHGRGIKPSKRPYFRWTDEQLEQLATLRDEGKSANEIAEALGVSSDKVITKLAAMAARQRAKPEAVREQIKQAEQELSTEPVPEAEAEPEQEAETEPSVEAEPEPELNPVSQDLNPTDVDLDRMIFTAFDNVVGKVDDFVTMSGCWRKVLTTIEKQLNELAYLVWEHPNTEESVCQIAAVIAYDEVRA
jgi:hypothetical protein